MTDDTNQKFAEAIDFGDGVPALNLDNDNGVDFKPVEQAAPKPLPTTAGVGFELMLTRMIDALATKAAETPAIKPKTVAITATIVGQLIVALAVVLGADPFIGGTVALAMMLTGFALAMVDVINGLK